MDEVGASHFSGPSNPIFQSSGFPAAGHEDRDCRVGCARGGAGVSCLCGGVGDRPCLPILSGLQCVVFVGKHLLFLQALMSSGGGQPCFQARLWCSSERIPLGSLDEGLDTANPPFPRYSITFLKVTVKTVSNSTVSACGFSSSSPRWQFALGCFVHISLFLIFTLCNPWVIKKYIIQQFFCCYGRSDPHKEKAENHVTINSVNPQSVLF